MSEAREKQGDWAFILGVVTLAAIAFALLFFTGCANMGRGGNDRDTKPEKAESVTGNSLAWARQWELLAMAAEAPSAAEEHSRLLDAMEHAAAMRDGWLEVPVLDAERPMYLPDGLASSKTEPQDDSAPIKGVKKRAGESLNELAEAGKEKK